MDSPSSTTQLKKPEGSAMPRETLTITDNRTGKNYEVPITHGFHPRRRPSPDQSRPR